MSRPVDLHGSLHRALYHPEKFERLELLGLPINVLMSVGLGRVRADGDGLFVFDDDGVEALIGAVMPGDEPVVGKPIAIISEPGSVEKPMAVSLPKGCCRYRARTR